MTPKRFYPQGNALTEPMPFTDRSGVAWLAYIEAGAAYRPMWSQAVLPERHIRFDSQVGSWFTTQVPAGSPFLAEARLRALLDQALPVPPAGFQQEVPVGHPHPALVWAARAGALGRALAGDWSRRVQELGSDISGIIHLAVLAVQGRNRARH
jgi:hypothetical protein